MDADSDFLNFAYLTCQRASVDEQIQMIPVKERPTYDQVKGYTPRYEPPINIAWSDAFPGASAWLADRDIKRTEHELLAPDLDTGSRLGLGAF